jgi:hypothetical protein
MKLLDGLRGSAGDFLDRGDATFSCRFKFNITWEPSDGAGKFFFDQVWLEDFEADTVVDGKSSVWSVRWVVGSPLEAAEPVNRALRRLASGCGVDNVRSI